MRVLSSSETRICFYWSRDLIPRRSAFDYFHTFFFTKNFSCINNFFQITSIYHTSSISAASVLIYTSKMWLLTCFQKKYIYTTNLWGFVIVSTVDGSSLVIRYSTRKTTELNTHSTVANETDMQKECFVDNSTQFISLVIDIVQSRREGHLRRRNLHIVLVHAIV